MSSVQLSGAGVAAVAFTKNGASSFDGLRLAPPSVRVCSSRRPSRSLVVKAATVVTPKYTSLKPLGDRVLVKLGAAEEKTVGGILLPSTAQSKPQGGEVVAVGEGRTIGDKKVEVSLQIGAEVVYSKYAGTEVQFNDTKHLILKEDDIIGVLETDDVKDMKPLNDRVLIKVAEAEDKTAGGLILTETTKEKPSIGTGIDPVHGRKEDERGEVVCVAKMEEAVSERMAAAVMTATRAWRRRNEGRRMASTPSRTTPCPPTKKLTTDGHDHRQDAEPPPSPAR